MGDRVIKEKADVQPGNDSMMWKGEMCVRVQTETLRVTVLGISL